MFPSLLNILCMTSNGISLYFKFSNQAYYQNPKIAKYAVFTRAHQCIFCLLNKHMDELKDIKRNSNLVAQADYFILN